MDVRQQSTERTFKFSKSKIMRFYVYALHGLAMEIFYTAMWDVATKGNRQLHGITSLWAAFIYGLALLTGEQLYAKMQNRHGVLFRGLVYLLWAYLWEFSTGLLLRLFNACPWDYTNQFYGNVMGLITLEYAPVWFVAGLVTEACLVKNTLRLTFTPQSDSKSS
uniref:Transmembrane protein 229B n=1 Tax=Trichuris muris TaxID=70415 RepID=A0A5S6QXG3_TRIMR